MRPTALERIAALVALLSLGVAIVSIFVGAAANWQALALMAGGLLVVVVAGWYAVSRRGRARATSVIVGLCGIGLLVAGVIGADMQLARVLALALLAALSVGSARVALRRSARAMRRMARSRTPAPPAKHPVLIINPRSGGASAERHQLVDQCRARGIDAIVMQPGDDLLQLAEDCIAKGADVIGMAGGDGSQALVATAAMAHDIPHVVVPAGTRNHLALDLGIDRSDVVGALDAYHDGVESRIDLAAVNGRVFVNNASVGLYAKVVQASGYREAKGRTALDVLPELLGPDAPSLDLRFTGPDGTAHPTAQVVLVSNDPYELHRFAGRGTRKRMDEGVLGVIAVRIPTALEAGHFVALEATRRSQRFQGWLEWTAPQFRIDSSGPVEIGVDGEALVLDPPLLFESRPSALRVRLPREAIGRSPTAKAVHVMGQSTVSELARVVAGRPAQEELTRAG